MLINGVELIERDDMVCRSARMNNGEFEPETFAFLDTLPVGGTFVDVGAYTGIYGIWAGNQGYSVVCFEPNPTIFDRLWKNMCANGFSWPCYNVALSDKKGTATFHIDPNLKMTSAGSVVPARNKKKQIEVRTDIYTAIGNESVIKIDVEGAELLVLKGMRSLLEIEQPVLIVEVLDREQENEVIAYTKQFGYNPLYKLDERNLILSV